MRKQREIGHNLRNEFFVLLYIDSPALMQFCDI
jgi:hypothetical protein